MAINKTTLEAYITTLKSTVVDGTNTIQDIINSIETTADALVTAKFSDNKQVSNTSVEIEFRDALTIHHNFATHVPLIKSEVRKLYVSPAPAGWTDCILTIEVNARDPLVFSIAMHLYL